MKNFKSLKKIIFATFVLFLIFLTGCGGGEVIRIFNWGDFLDEILLSEFTEETGIRVIYSNFASNEEMYARLTSGGAEYDLLFPSDYMIERLISEGRLARIDFSNIPNITNIDPRFLNTSYDPEGAYSVAYMWGTLGVLYNSSMIFPEDSVDSWSILWNENYARSIYMYDSMRDSFTVAQKLLGFSINSKDETELALARDLLIAQRPLVRAFVGDDVKHSMIGAEAALAVVYSGDAIYSMEFNSELRFANPKEGTNLFIDAMVIPVNAPNKEGAESFINFLNRPEIAARNSEYIGYTTANLAALPFIPEEMRENPYFWQEEALNNPLNEQFLHLGDFTALMDRAWTQVLATR